MVHQSSIEELISEPTNLIDLYEKFNCAAAIKEISQGDPLVEEWATSICLAAPEIDKMAHQPHKYYLMVMRQLDLTPAQWTSLRNISFSTNHKTAMQNIMALLCFYHYTTVHPKQDIAPQLTKDMILRMATNHHRHKWQAWRAIARREFWTSGPCIRP